MKADIGSSMKQPSPLSPVQSPRQVAKRTKTLELTSRFVLVQQCLYNNALANDDVQLVQAWWLPRQPDH